MKTTLRLMKVSLSVHPVKYTNMSTMPTKDPTYVPIWCGEEKEEEAAEEGMPKSRHADKA